MKTIALRLRSSSLEGLITFVLSIIMYNKMKNLKILEDDIVAKAANGEKRKEIINSIVIKF